MERVLLKEEEVPGDGAMCGFGTDRRRRHRNKEGRTKKPKGGEVEEQVPGDGAMCGIATDRHKRHRKDNKEEGRTKKPKGGDVAAKPKSGEAMEEMPASKEKAGKRRETKMVSWTLSNELIGYLHTKEIMGFLATETPRPLWPNATRELLGTKLREEIASTFKENREFEADILYEYRTYGVVKFQQVVNVDVDDEEMEV